MEHRLVRRARASFPLRVVEHLFRDDATILAGGVAMFLLLGLLPTLAAVVSIYALLADPHDIHWHLKGLDKVLPAAVFELLLDQLQRAARRSQGELGLAVAGSTVLALYSMRSSADALLTGIEHVDGTPPRWRGWRRLLLTTAMAIGAVISSVTLLATVIAMPATSAAVSSWLRHWLYRVRWPVLIAVGVLSLSGLYRLGSGHRKFRHIVPGALCATAIGLLASIGVNYYVTEWASYGNLYGAFGGAMIVILWFYTMSLAVLIGAVVNVELRSPSG